ncbi:MAG TPA: glycosyltransferase family 4 protein [Methyloceanibacter sp.]|nr:glycosyltransferase family 4 protein [Methyloceanibacter sp.]
MTDSISNTGCVRVLALTKYGPLAASSRHRFFDYIPFLEQKGVSVTPAPLLSEAYVRDIYSGKSPDVTDIARSLLSRLLQLVSARQFDVLWIEGELFPRLPASIERLLALCGCPYVVDLDDAIFHTYDRNPRPFVRRLLGQKIDVVFRKAAAVTAGSDYLAERARQAGARKVVVVPTTVDIGAYSEAHAAQNQLTFVWIGSPVTERYLKSIEGELGQLLPMLPAKLHLIGISPSSNLSLPGAVYRPWSAATEGAEVASCDIGLAPLTDGPWERGKCGLKAIQYMAAGIPVLAADVGALSNIVVHGKTGFVYLSTPE